MVNLSQNILTTDEQCSIRCVPPGGVDATVTSNNVQAGEVSCQYIADRLQGKGSVVIINGPPVASVVERVQGCQSVFSKYPDIKVLSKDQNAEGSRDGGLRVMSDVLTSFPKIDAVFAMTPVPLVQN
jgi:ribose transport system substrate-binding protein